MMWIMKRWIINQFVVTIHVDCTNNNEITAKLSIINKNNNKK